MLNPYWLGKSVWLKRKGRKRRQNGGWMSVHFFVFYFSLVSLLRRSGGVTVDDVCVDVVCKWASYQLLSGDGSRSRCMAAVAL